MSNIIRYINTDLELVSAQDLADFATVLESKGLLALHVTCCEDKLWRAAFETAVDRPEPEAAITQLIEVIESLSEPAQTIWHRCVNRSFDIGYECGQQPPSYKQEISSDLLGRIASVGAALRITLYPTVNEDG
ncbi:MAG: hypothetical protein WA885_21365 [Phormidesmis sp.]